VRGSRQALVVPCQRRAVRRSGSARATAAPGSCAVPADLHHPVIIMSPGSASTGPGQEPACGRPALRQHVAHHAQSPRWRGVPTSTGPFRPLSRCRAGSHVLVSSCPVAGELNLAPGMWRRLIGDGPSHRRLNSRPAPADVEDRRAEVGWRARRRRTPAARAALPPASYLPEPQQRRPTSRPRSRTPAAQPTPTFPSSPGHGPPPGLHFFRYTSYLFDLNRQIAKPTFSLS